MSGRAAVRKTSDPEEREQLQGRVHELLADLEQQVIRNGADERMLAAIERERRSVYDDDTEVTRFVTEQDGAPSGKHILVVNDTEEILDLFRSILEDLGHRTTAWSYSPDDLAKVTDIQPDLVILDLLMGPTELQGWALLQKLRMSPPTESIPVIVCSAATNWVREQEGWLAANAVKVVLKPFKVTDLERAVSQAFALPDVMAKSPTASDLSSSAPTASEAPSDGPTA